MYRAWRASFRQNCHDELSFSQVSVVHTEFCFSQLPRGRWPLLTVLHLDRIDDRSRGLLCDPLPQGMSWGRMHFNDLYAGRVRQNKDVVALTLGKWPCLQSLTLDNFPVFAQDVTALVQAAWPELTSLTMLGCFQKTETITLCMQRWPGLRSLTLGSLVRKTHYLAKYAQSAYPTLNFFACVVDSLEYLY